MYASTLDIYKKEEGKKQNCTKDPLLCILVGVGNKSKQPK